MLDQCRSYSNYRHNKYSRWCCLIENAVMFVFPMGEFPSGILLIVFLLPSANPRESEVVQGCPGLDPSVSLFWRWLKFVGANLSGRFCAQEDRRGDETYSYYLILTSVLCKSARCRRSPQSWLNHEGKPYTVSKYVQCFLCSTFSWNDWNPLTSIFSSELKPSTSQSVGLTDSFHFLTKIDKAHVIALFNLPCQSWNLFNPPFAVCSGRCLVLFVLSELECHLPLSMFYNIIYIIAYFSPFLVSQTFADDSRVPRVMEFQRI